MGKRVASKLSGTYRCLILSQLRNILSYRKIENAIVVVRSDQITEFRDVLQTASKDIQSKTLIIENSLPESEPGESLKMGIQASNGKSCFVSPVDIPIKTQVLERLALEIKSGTHALKPSYARKGGHPIYLSSKATADFQKASENRLDLFLKNHKVDILEIDDQDVLLNLNTLEDWYSFKKRF